MGRWSVPEEIQWLAFRNSSHATVLLSLLAKTRVGAADDKFVPLYALAAAGPHTERFVDHGTVDFDGLIRASTGMGPEVVGLIRLAAALSDPPRSADIYETFASLAETPSFEIALHALRMRWEV